MIAEQVKNKEYLEETIKKLKMKNPSADIQLLEKTVGALFLVESLANENLEFIFKGGTSLVLLLESLKRFSVDVDIITEENKDTVREKLTNIINNQNLFIRFEEIIRENSASQRMDLEHFKFFFNSVTDNSEKYILLDVAYEDNKYPQIINKQINSVELNVHSELVVKIPSVESILGDKMTVLATHSTGISFNSNKELELMKQLYDVDKLFNSAIDINIIKESFINIATRELKYRKLTELTYETVLDDIEEFSKNIIFLNDKEHIEKISTGMKKLACFRIEKKFLIDKEVLTAASKVLYITYLIKNNVQSIEKYSDKNKENVSEEDKEILKEYKKRMKIIKKMNPEAYFYILKSL